MRTGPCLLLLSLSAPLAVVGCAGPPPEATAEGRVQDTSAGRVRQDSTRQGVHRDRRFTGYVRIRTAAGPDSVRVELTNLDLHDHTTLDRIDLPFEGSITAYLVAGSAAVLIDGQRTERSQGEIWTVPAGASLGIATDRDAASLQLIVIERRKP